MEEKVTGIVVGARDKGDFDKYLVLVTDAGKRNCIIKGVKRAASKLRFAGELFSLCEYTLTAGHGSAVVTNAYNLSMNYELRTDYDRYLAAAAAAKLSEAFCSEQDGEFLPFLLASLEFIKADEKLGFVRFLLGLFARSGYALDLVVCGCGKKLGDTAFYSSAASGIACESCGGQRIRPGVLSLLRRAERGELSEEGEDPDFYRGAVRLLAYHLANAAEGAGVLEDYLAALKKFS